MNLPTLVIALLFAFVARSVSAKERFFTDCKACKEKCNWAGYFHAYKTVSIYRCSCNSGYLGVDKKSCFATGSPDTSSASSSSIYDVDKAHDCSSCQQCVKVGFVNGTSHALYECSCKDGQRLNSDGSCSDSPGARRKYLERKHCDKCKKAGRKCEFAGSFEPSRRTAYVCLTLNCKRTMRGHAYRGDVSRTISGKTCQAWASQAPHKHKNFHSDRPNAGLEKNYCRNPDNEPKGPWCYTTDRNTRWEYCAIPFCKATGSPDTSSANKAHVSNCNSCTQLCLQVGNRRVLYKCYCKAGQKLDSDGRGCTESPGARSKYLDGKDCFNNCKKAGGSCNYAGRFKPSRRKAYVCV